MSRPSPHRTIQFGPSYISRACVHCIDVNGVCRGDDMSEKPKVAAIAVRPRSQGGQHEAWIIGTAAGATDWRDVCCDLGEDIRFSPRFWPVKIPFPTPNPTIPSTLPCAFSTGPTSHGT